MTLWTVIINRNLIRGVEKGVQNEARTCKFDSMIEHMEKKYVAFTCMSLAADKVIVKILN